MNKVIAYGLTISSEIDLPGMPASHAATQVIVRKAKVEKPPGNPEAERIYAIDREEFRVHWCGVGTFLIRMGNEVLVEAEPNTEEAVVRLYILGPALSILLHQRGFLVLHASVISIHGEAIGFLGEKGWGKSTTAAMLNARGHALVADDMLAVLPNAPCVPMVQPGFPQFKLWPESVSASFGEDPTRLTRLHSKVEKRIRKANSNAGRKPIPLKRLYVLDRGETLKSVLLPSPTALMFLIQHSYLSRIMMPLRGSRENFLQCSRLAKSVPTHRLFRPSNLNGLAEIASLVEKEAGWNPPVQLTSCAKPSLMFNESQPV